MPNFYLDYTGVEINTLLSKIDEAGDEMKRYIVKLVKQGNDYVIQNIEGEQLDFEGLSQTIRDTSKYVVMVYGNSKLRPQYVSGSEMMFIGLDRAGQNAKVLRVLFTATRCTYEVFNLQEEITDLATIRSGAELGATALQSVPDTYALRSEIPTNNNQLTNGAGYVTTSYHDSTKQDVISNLSTIIANATAGKGASDTIASYGDIVTHNADEFATTQALTTHTGNTTIHVTANDKVEWSKKQNAITDLDDIRSGASLGATALQSVPDNYATKTYVTTQGYAKTNDLLEKSVEEWSFTLATGEVVKRKVVLGE